ncbi:MAG: DUF6165 family protein [Pirellulaceae bacterium]
MTKQSEAITVEIAAGELMDKITILEIKTERIEEVSKLANIRTELDMLLAARDRALVVTTRLEPLIADLKSANEHLWEIEDEIRECERHKEFGPRFVELARSVYRTNDRRCAIKRQINQISGSRWTEEKSYKDYE